MLPNCNPKYKTKINKFNHKFACEEKIPEKDIGNTYLAKEIAICKYVCHFDSVSLEKNISFSSKLL